MYHEKFQTALAVGAASFSCLSFQAAILPQLQEVSALLSIIIAGFSIGSRITRGCKAFRERMGK